MGENSFNPRAMAVGRHALGLTQTQLAQRAGVTQVAISHWERGERTPDHDATARLAVALDITPEALGDHDVATAIPMFRAASIRSKMKVREVEGRIEHARLAAARILHEVEVEGTLPWPDHEDPVPEQPDAAARRLRTVWRIAPGPLTQLTQYIEAAGAVVIRCAFGNSKVEAAYSHPRRDSVRWLLLNTDAHDGARVRLSLAHELGHAILHHWDSFNVADEAERERQAYAFALALLLPPDELVDDLARTARRWDDFLSLRPRWGVSAAALVRRARDLGMVTDSQYRSLNIERRSRGHWAYEPVDVPIETPSTFPDTVELLRRELGWSTETFARAAGLTPHRLADLLPEQFTATEPPAPRLRIVDRTKEHRMSDYHVTPNPDGGWDAKRAGGQRASSHHQTQADAQRAATGFADRSGGGEVCVHGRNGQIRNSNTIGKKDPFPPRDTKH